MPSNTHKIQVLIVAGRIGMREAISAPINTQRDLTVIGQAAAGRAAINRFKRPQPDASPVDTVRHSSRDL